MCMLHLLHWRELRLEYVSKLTIFTDILLWTCGHAHEQRVHGLQLIGMAIKNTVFVTFVGLVDPFEA